MSFDPHHDRDRNRRRPHRNSWTDIAYLIVAAAGFVLLARLWTRVVQPWAAGVLAQLTWPDLLLWAVVLVLALAVAVRWRVTQRRRRAARGLRVVDLPRHTRATDPMASGDNSSTQGQAQGGRRPSRSDAKRP